MALAAVREDRPQERDCHRNVETQHPAAQDEIALHLGKLLIDVREPGFLSRQFLGRLRPFVRSACFDRLPKALSGGQRQRVALARALVRRPGVYLTDEPLSNLGAKLRIEARSFLAKMHQEIGVTTVYVTHDQSEAMTMGDTIVVMKDGVIQQAASPLEVYNKPANTFVAGFIGSPAMNFLELSLADSKLIDPHDGLAIAIPERLRGALDGYGKPKVVLGVRPEALRPSPRNAASTGAPVLSIDVAQHMGHETLLDASSGPHRVVARVSAADDSRIGEKRPFLFDSDQMHLFDLETGVNLAAGSRLNA
jgi:multiple sugar transport system ATP-binding protein